MNSKKLTSNRPFFISNRSRRKFVEKKFRRVCDLAYALKKSISIFNYFSIYNELLNLVDDMLVVDRDFTIYHVKILDDSLNLNLPLSKWDIKK